jgi:hypothetical protein
MFCALIDAGVLRLQGDLGDLISILPSMVGTEIRTKAFMGYPFLPADNS